jgi:XTP/dITP diphosphohydrolase
MPALYIATSNAGKLRDFAAAASLHGLKIRPLPGIESIAAPEETAATFEGNARDKAIYYSRFASGEIVLADDSGLEVAALNGAPGVRSARYAADAAAAADQPPKSKSAAETDRENNDLVLNNLSHIPEDARNARYRCVLAAARDGKVILTAEGSVEGRILTTPQGTGGFGYDPIFYLPELNKTMAEIDLETKHTLSHRGRAFRALLAALMPIDPSDAAPAAG